VFLSRLREDFGVTGGVTDWMESYLSDRHQVININGALSDRIKIKYGFPQGSKIGPFGFKLYTKPLTAIAEKHGINIILYADDTQLYCTFDPNESEEAMSRMEACIEEIRSWMKDNYLKLNDSKTDFIIFGTPHDIDRVTEWTVSVGDQLVFPSMTVKDIGPMLDSALTMESQINSVIKSCYNQIRNISRIRYYLTEEATKTLMHALVTSRLDNMNALLYNLPDFQIQKLQKIQNHAARIVKKSKKHDHITPLLFDLHWLPVKFRIDYKILLLVFKCLHGEGPEYLASLLEHYQQPIALRSVSQHRLKRGTL
jgi:hypothetical protein